MNNQELATKRFSSYFGPHVHWIPLIHRNEEGDIEIDRNRARALQLSHGDSIKGQTVQSEGQQS